MRAREVKNVYKWYSEGLVRSLVHQYEQWQNVDVQVRVIREQNIYVSVMVLKYSWAHHIIARTNTFYINRAWLSLSLTHSLLRIFIFLCITGDGVVVAAVVLVVIQF